MSDSEDNESASLLGADALERGEQRTSTTKRAFAFDSTPGGTESTPGGTIDGGADKLPPLK